MIIDGFNYGFFILVTVFIGIIVALSLAFKDKPEKTKKTVILAIGIANLLLYCAYKLYLVTSPVFAQLKGETSHSIFSELPLQLCNINLFLLPIGLLLKKRALMGFSFFSATLGAVMALLSPEPVFIGFSLFKPWMFGYYITHLTLIVCGVLLVTYGFYKPEFKSIPGVMLTFIVLGTCMHGVNALLRATVYPQANYFYTFSHDGVSILKLFWSWIPHPYFYVLPAILIFAAYMSLVCLGFFAAGKIRVKFAKQESVVIE